MMDWTLTRQVEEQGSVTRYRRVFTHADILTAAGSDDLLFGGAGDDWLVRSEVNGNNPGNDSTWRMVA